MVARSASGNDLQPTLVWCNMTHNMNTHWNLILTARLSRARGPFFLLAINDIWKRCT
jgi:hypothetical protein